MIDGPPRDASKRLNVDTAVAIVETYLRLHGYFTVTEFPVVELRGG